MSDKTGKQLYESWAHQQPNRCALPRWGDLAGSTQIHWNKQAIHGNAATSPAMNTASPTDKESIRFRFFKDLIAAERLKVFKAFGVYPENCTESLNHSIERRLLNSILNRAAPVGQGSDLDCPSCGGSGETTAIAGSGPDGYEVAVNCDSCDGTGAVNQGSATKGIIPDAAHVVALALSGALKEPHAKQILRDAFKKSDQGSATSGEAAPHEVIADRQYLAGFDAGFMAGAAGDDAKRAAVHEARSSEIRAALAASAEQSNTNQVDREKIMQQWDQYRALIASGFTGSRPRDWFEALLDSLLIGKAASAEQSISTGAVHQWDGDGERCTVCGDKDWMAGPKCSGKGSAPVAERAAAPASVPEEPVELIGVARQMDEGAGFWQTCSGCHESEDGHDVGRYAYSSALRCKLGNGCSECGGLGAVWDNNDYAEWAAAEQNAAPEVAQPAAQGEPPC